MSELQLPYPIYEALLAQARGAAPIEACGILAGKGGHICAYHPMTNTDGSTDHFMMDPREQFAVAKAIRAAGHELLAVHHSHPASPARPSAEDIRLAATPGVVYTILSLADPSTPTIKGFLIGSSVHEVPLIVVRDSEAP